MIEVQGLTKIYGVLTAIHDLSFTVAEGEVLGFLGPNGAGKTTTMRILAGSLGATQGSATVAGFEVHKHPKEVKRRLGYMPEFPPLYQSMDVLGYLNFAAKIKAVPRAKRASAVDRAVGLSGLGNVRKRVIGQLSKGYRQRVGLAQALVHEPKVLVLDEPTSGLDPAQITEVREVIRGLGGDHTVILSTHILPEVTMTCDRIVIIDRGRIVAADTEESLAQRLAGQRRVALQVARSGDDCERTLTGLEGVLGVVRLADHSFAIDVGTTDLRETIATAVVDAGYGLLDLREDVASLEDIYLNLVGAGVGMAPPVASVAPAPPPPPAEEEGEVSP